MNLLIRPIFLHNSCFLLCISSRQASLLFCDVMHIDTKTSESSSKSPFFAVQNAGPQISIQTRASKHCRQSSQMQLVCDRFDIRGSVCDSEQQRVEPLFRAALRPFADSTVDTVPLMFVAYSPCTNHSRALRARLNSSETAVPRAAW